MNESNDVDSNIINEDIVLNTLPIKIHLAFNSQFKITDLGDIENSVEFNYGLISKNQILANISGSNKYKYPYFTNNVMYPEDVLLVNGPEFAVEFFFDKERFEQLLLKYSSNTYVNDKSVAAADPESTESQALNDNATFNINLMLRVLLPISSEFGFALTSSYHRYIRKDFITNIFPLNTYDINMLFQNTKWIIEAEGKPQYVQNVIWASSMLDNPHYFYLLYVYNNSLVRRRNLINQAKDDYIIKVLSLLNNLYRKLQPSPDDANAKNLFELILEDLKRKSTQSSNREYEDLLKTLNNFITNDISSSLNKFIHPPGGLLLMKDNNSGEKITYSINKDKVVKAINDETLNSEINNMISTITNMYVTIYDYRESVKKSTTGIKQFNFDSIVSPIFDKAYRDCVEVKALALIRRFIEGTDPYMDLNEKNTSDQDKTAHELDIIKYIKTSNPIYREINDAISKVMKNLYPPIRESLNRLLQKELTEIKIKAQNKAEKKQTEDTCVNAKKNADFLRDVYSRYFKPNAGFSEFDDHKLFTSVGIQTTSDGARYYEIFVVVDTVDKEKYDAPGSKCLVNEDIVMNSLMNAVSSKSKDKIGFVRNHKALNAASTIKKNPTPKQNGGNNTRRKHKFN